jgi:hypothetical protein
MPPLSPHRRARKRSRRRLIVFLACTVVLAVLLVGGVTQIGRQSNPFYVSVNRSFATQGATVVHESNATGATLRTLMRNMADQDRQTLQAELDLVAAQANQEATAAENLASPVTPGGVQVQFARVFAQRDQAVLNFRSALDGLLGLRPLPVAGAPGVTTLILATPALLSSTQAAARITAAGSVLSRSDGSYRSLRLTLRHLDGHARLPASRWVTSATAWQAGPVATAVELVNASTSLAATPRLVLSVVKVTPPALPSPSGVATPGVSVLSPPKSVLVQVVLTNLGSVNEPHASVQLQLTPQPGGTDTAAGTGAGVTITRTAGIAAGGSVSLSAASFKVKPGTNYQLTVDIVLPAGQDDVNGASLSEVLQVAPST